MTLTLTEVMGQCVDSDVGDLTPMLFGGCLISSQSRLLSNSHIQLKLRLTVLKKGDSIFMMLQNKYNMFSSKDTLFYFTFLMNHYDTKLVLVEVCG